jgi:hypothetical protein
MSFRQANVCIQPGNPFQTRADSLHLEAADPHRLQT